jgi:hypothetical protein
MIKRLAGFRCLPAETTAARHGHLYPEMTEEQIKSVAQVLMGLAAAR